MVKIVVWSGALRMVMSVIFTDSTKLIVFRTLDSASLSLQDQSYCPPPNTNLCSGIALFPDSFNVSDALSSLLLAGIFASHRLSHVSICQICSTDIRGGDSGKSGSDNPVIHGASAALRVCSLVLALAWSAASAWAI